MKSSNSNYGPSNETNPSFGFNSQPLGSGSVSGLPRPRLVKMRKQTASHRRGVADLDFNPFRPFSESGTSVLGNLNSGYVATDTFSFGANKSATNTSSNSNSESQTPSGRILDDMRKLNIASVKDYATADNAAFNLKLFESDIKKNVIDDSLAAELPNEISRLKIRDSGNVGSLKNSQGVDPNFNASNKNQFSKGSDSSVGMELPNEMNKLNIKDPGGVDRGSDIYSDDNMKKFVFGTNSKVRDSFSSSLETVLPVKMMNLNIRDSVNTCDGHDEKDAKNGFGLKNRFVSESSRNTTSNSSAIVENLISDEMRELKLSEAGDTSGQAGRGLHSTVTANEAHTDYSSDKKLNDHRNDEKNDAASPSASSSSSFSSSHFQPFGKAFDVPSMSRSEKNVEFAFASKLDSMGTPHVEFKTPNLKGKLFSGVSSKFEAKKESAKDTRSTKKKGKSRKPITGQLRHKQDFVFGERSSQENPDSFESYSPMDVSPYQEMLADNNYSRETSVTSEEASQFNDNYVSSESYPTVSNDAPDEDLVSATHRLDISDSDVKYSITRAEVSENYFNEGIGTEAPFEDSVSGAETESFMSANEHLDYSSDTFVTALDSEVSSSATSRGQENDVTSQFSFASNSEDVGMSSFTFAASSSTQGQSSAEPRQNKKKHRLKIGHDSYSSTPNTKIPYVSPSVEFFPQTGTPLLSPRQGHKGDINTLSSRSKDKAEPIKEQDIKRETASTSAASIASQEACEKWRLRGNQAYGNGDLSKAEDYYTQGVKSVFQSETSRSCLRALMLCYSNRAATRMSLGRMREALDDCQMAATIDPNFLKVQVRVAHCYLALGEFENASLHFMRCLQSGPDVCVDRKLLVEASEGLEKAQKVSECIKQYTELLQRRTSDDIECALRVIDEALKISSFSEKLLEMKADALFMLQKYEQVIQVCDQTLSSAEIDSPTLAVGGKSIYPDGSDLPRSSSSRLWRLCLIVKSCFYLGRLEEALDFIKKQEDSGPILERGSMSLESVIPLAETVRELLSRKAAGNEAFKSRRHAEAVEHYTAALSCNVESRPFAAICFCNRAAAYRALGQITDAIADCSLAIALDPNYFKAISRRASLFEMIRDYGQAAIDLQRLVSLLTKQVEEKGNLSGVSDQLSCVNFLRETQVRLSGVEEEARKDTPLNMYLILGVESSAAASEIKKAYRKAALKHHPDKAGQSLTRSDNGDDGLWKEIAENVHKDTDRLFKMIGEAYAVLSNPTKRPKYDLDEEMRNEPNRFTGSSTSRMAADFQNSVFERSGSRRQRQDVWRAHNTPQSQGPERSSGSYRYSSTRFS